MIFFITGVGRSGTMFLTNLLNRCKDTKVLHEPSYNRAEYLKSFRDKKASLKYVLNTLKDLTLKNAEGTKIYGEIDSYYRYHVPALKIAFPEAKFLHLIRDGRDVVRSIYSRGSFSEGDTTTIGVYPIGGWKNESRFEKICWYWVESNTRVHEHIDKFVNLEKIVSDWDYFKENVLDYLGLEMPKKVWENLRTVRINENRSRILAGFSAKRKPIRAVQLKKLKEEQQHVNRNTRFRIPHHTKWTKEQKRIFNRVCKKTMELYGY